MRCRIRVVSSRRFSQKMRFVLIAWNYLVQGYFIVSDNEALTVHEMCRSMWQNK